MDNSRYFDKIKEMDMLKEAMGDLSGKNVVFILADDCSYSGGQINELENKINRLKEIYAFPHEHVILVPYICKKHVREKIIKLHSENRFSIIYDKINEYSSSIKSVSEIINDNKTKFEECKKIIDRLNDYKNEDSNKYRDEYNFNVLREIINSDGTVPKEECKELIKLFTYRLQKFIQGLDIVEMYEDGTVEELDEIKDLFDLFNLRNIKNKLQIRTRKNDYVFKLYLFKLRDIANKISDNQIFNLFLKLEMDNRFLLYFDFTFADSTSLNTDLMNGTLLGDEYPEFIDINRPLDIFGDKYIIDKHKNNTNDNIRIPFINNCDNFKVCPPQIYKKIIYLINKKEVTISDIERDTGEGKDLFDLLEELYSS